MVFSCRRPVVLVLVLSLFSIACVFIFNETAQSSLYSKLKIATPSQVTSGVSNENLAEPSGLARENATFYTLCRNSDIYEMKAAVDSVESKINRRFKYDWVFLNDEEFSSDFKHQMKERISGNTYFGKIDSSVWGYPEWINQTKAAETRDWMRAHNVVYGDKESYHHMCRFQAGFFFQHELMNRYKYAWRVEPSIEILCKLNADPFKQMRANKWVYGFNIAPREIKESITTLWNVTKKYLDDNPGQVHENSLKSFISDDDLQSYNFCHYWTNFEISDMDWLRSKQYLDYFTHLDKEGGFFYERWGDAPIRSIAASLFLHSDQVHFFNEIGYFHAPYGHCPYGQGALDLECDCHPREDEIELKYYDYHEESCMRNYFKAKGRSYNEINPKLKKGP